MNMLTTDQRQAPPYRYAGRPRGVFSYANTDVQFMTDTAQYTTALFPARRRPAALHAAHLLQANVERQLDHERADPGWIRLVNPEVAYTGTAERAAAIRTARATAMASSAARRSRVCRTDFREALATVDLKWTSASSTTMAGRHSQFRRRRRLRGYDHVRASTKTGLWWIPRGADPSTNNHIWSHRYNLLNSYVTNDPPHR